MAVIFNIPHAAPNFDEYTASQTDGGDLSVVAEAALGGSRYGLSVNVDDNVALLAYKALAMASTTGIFRVGFLFDPNSISRAANDSHNIMLFATSGSQFLGGVSFGRNASNTAYTLYATLQNAPANHVQSTAVEISDEPHWIEYHAVRGAGTGQAHLYIDGLLVTSTIQTNNSTVWTNVASLAVGATSNVDTGTRGVYYIDEIIANDDGSEIGPYGPNVFEATHEGNNTSEWSNVVQDLGSVAVTAGAALASTDYGLAFTFDGSTDEVYTQYMLPTPDFHRVSRFRFYFDPNDINILTGEYIRVVSLYGYAAGMIFHLRYYDTGRLRVGWLRDGGTGIGNYVTITNAPHIIEIEVVRASSATASDGSIRMWVDEVLTSTNSANIDNYDSWTDFSYWQFGVQSVSSTSIVGGTFYIDEVVINVDGSEIGPLDEPEPEIIYGEADLIFGSFEISGSAAVGIHGQASIIFSPIEISGSGTTRISAQGSMLFDPIEITGAGVLPISLQSSIMFEPLEITGEIDASVEGESTIVFEPISIAGTIEAKIQAQSSLTFEPFDIQGAAESPITGVGELAFLPFESSGYIFIGEPPLVVNGSLTFDPMQILGEGIVEIQAESSINFLPFEVVAEGTIRIAAQGLIGFDPFLVEGIIGLTDPPEAPDTLVLVVSMELSLLLEVDMQIPLDVGDSPKITGTFSRAGVPIDPVVVTAEYRHELAQEAVLLTPTREDVGVYSFRIPLDVPGVWLYRMQGDGVIAAQGKLYALTNLVET